MTDPNKLNGEITIAETLRDKAWEYLPGKAREAKQGVSVTYWPVGVGVVKLTVAYDPQHDSLEINADETVQTTVEAQAPDSYRAFMHYKGVELNATTSEVILYGENADVRDEYGYVIESPEEYIETTAEPLSAEWQAEHILMGAADQPLDILDTDAFYTFTQDKLDYLMGLFDKV